jgi:hypothetical protein
LIANLGRYFRARDGELFYFDDNKPGLCCVHPPSCFSVSVQLDADDAEDMLVLGVPFCVEV